jgi:uncharacterized damage-inducible protein DinB
MDALELLRNQAAMADGLMSQVIAPVTAEQAEFHPEGSVGNSIGKMYPHVYISQDRLVHRLQDRPPLLAQGWQERLGFDPDTPWYQQSNPDLDVSRAYAKAVQDATMAFLSNVSPEVLAREIDAPFGRMPAINTLSVLLVLHKMIHMGEISALLGVQGERGLPF